MTDPGEVLRIDRWLFFCRFFKTRSKAQAAVSGGHVRVNGERASPGTRVQRGDRIDLKRDRLAYSLRVAKVPTRRGPASEAQQCFEEDEDSIRAREATTAALRSDRLSMPVTGGRPDKNTRRKLIRRNRG